MNWTLDPSVSTFGPDIDRIYYIILAITTIVFLATEFLLFWFLIRYRKREGHRAEYIHGSMRAEVIWTAVPFVVVVGLAVISAPVWAKIKDPTQFPEDAYQIMLTARQFEWEVRYAGADGEFGTEQDFTVLNRLNVPVDRPVLVLMESTDVIHSFYVHDFRLKQDIVPGMTIPMWFEVTRPGEYTLGCAELCGIGHYRMDGVVVVQAQDEFAAWEAEQIAARQEQVAASAAGGVVAASSGGAAAPADF